VLKFLFRNIGLVLWMQRVVCSDVMEVVIGPLQEKMDDWKKAAVALDKDHAKGKPIIRLSS